jgi:hypothetical protein
MFETMVTILLLVLWFWHNIEKTVYWLLTKNRLSHEEKETLTLSSQLIQNVRFEKQYLCTYFLFEMPHCFVWNSTIFFVPCEWTKAVVVVNRFVDDIDQSNSIFVGIKGERMTNTDAVKYFLYKLTYLFWLQYLKVCAYQFFYFV